MIGVITALAVFAAVIYTSLAMGLWFDAKSDWDYYGENLIEGPPGNPYALDRHAENRKKALKAAYRMNNFWGTPIIALRQAMATKRDALRVAQEYDNKEGHAGS